MAVTYSRVGVLSAQLSGLDALFVGRPTEQSIALLSELVAALDDAAERCQVEKLRTSGPHYVAVSGLATTRLDQAQLVFDFAQELVRIVRAFGSQHHLDLTVKLGLHSGPLVGGVIGRKQLNFDLFGETMDIATALQERAPSGFIYLSKPIYEGIRNPQSCVALDPLQIGNQTVGLWSYRV